MPSPRLVPVNCRPIGPDVLLTSRFGDFAFVTADEHASLVRGDLVAGSPLERRLERAHLLTDRVDRSRLVRRLRRKKGFLAFGPNLHVLVVTLRCNQTCVYCHASRASMDRTDTDMAPETAEAIVDLAMRSTSPRITFEFQGGEPLANFDVVRHTVETAIERNRSYGKQLEFTLVSNLSLMTEERLDYLIDRRVQICTSVDGPAGLHDRQRILPGRSAHQETIRWLRRINRRYAQLGLDEGLYHVEALLTTTRAALGQAKQIVDTYVDLGCRAIFLRPVDPFGFASVTGKTVAYPRDEYAAFYRQAVDYILELNRAGTQVLERFASIFLTKILTDDDPNYLDIRSPCGAGIGQLAYNYDGRVFTCDEGRMLDAAGDASFCIGHVASSSYRELVTHDTVAAIVVASNLDAQPDCVGCTYQPFCGVCPVHSHATLGSLHGRTRESALCAVHKSIQDYLFEKLREGETSTLETFRRWTQARPRAHFVQGTAPAPHPPGRP